MCALNWPAKNWTVKILDVEKCLLLSWGTAILGSHQSMHKSQSMIFFIHTCVYIGLKETDSRSFCNF